MTHKQARRLQRVRGWLERLSLPALLALGGLIVVASGTGAYYAYRAYDYVEHDNAFCFSCHLMQEPFELFAKSAHRGLGCKACHQPNLIERSQMGVTGVVGKPTAVSVHAEVPNDLCAACHIDGDPEKWTLIASSAGHRVHFESEDPALDGLQCVECHSSSLHEFTAVDQTCAQSGCHVDSQVQLGAMSDLTIHCAACHGFSAPAENVTEAALAMAPNEDTCFSCHAMRVLVEMPDPDPHAGSCASCHNPHDQETPAAAVESCATAGCHDDFASITPFHEGLEPAVMGDCLYCHQAHAFDVDGSNCVACHEGIINDDPVTTRMSSLGPGAAHPSVGSARRVAQRSALDAGLGMLHSSNYPLPQSIEFRHSQHPDLECADCHDSSERHGEVTVRSVTDCRSCHHSDEQVSADGCVACHAQTESRGDPHAALRPLSLSFVFGPNRAVTLR